MTRGELDYAKSIIDAMQDDKIIECRLSSDDMPRRQDAWKECRNPRAHRLSRLIDPSVIRVRPECTHGRPTVITKPSETFRAGVLEDYIQEVRCECGATWPSLLAWEACTRDQAPKLKPYSYETFPRSAHGLEWSDRQFTRIEWFGATGIRCSPSKADRASAATWTYDYLLCMGDDAKLLDHNGNELPKGVRE